MRLLSPPAALYAAVMSLRAAAYARNLFQAWRPPCPCISVGNIRWGGTGKTPVCAWLTQWATERNKQCVVLTRGYRAHPPSLPYLVSPDASPREAGDEPLLLARSNPKSKVVVDPKRIRSGRWAWNQWRPDLFLLDDGFQHMAVQRDVNLVLLTLRDLYDDWNSVLPGGPWREGPTALSRADAFLVKLPDLNMSNPSHQQRVSTRLISYGKPIFLFTPQPLGLTDIRSNERHPTLPPQSGSHYALFSGVADPLSVEHTASSFFGAKPARFDAFTDHHSFSGNNLARLAQKARNMGVGHLVCTTKDAVKVRELLPRKSDLHWWSLDTTVRFEPFTAKDPRFEDWLEHRLIHISARS